MGSFKQIYRHTQIFKKRGKGREGGGQKERERENFNYRGVRETMLK